MAPKQLQNTAGLDVAVADTLQQLAHSTGLAETQVGPGEGAGGGWNGHGHCR